MTTRRLLAALLVLSTLVLSLGMLGCGSSTTTTTAAPAVTSGRTDDGARPHDDRDHRATVRRADPHSSRRRRASRRC